MGVPSNSGRPSSRSCRRAFESSHSVSCSTREKRNTTTVYYSCDWKATQEIGFDDAFQYEDFAKPPDRRSITLEQLHPELGATSYEAWADKTNKHPY
ncbi:hypothetical protein ACFVYE_34050 [Streptomyces sp. NPDC058239]|uniref:hypothetical protein n=1 Tax=Streptomyces sp. NPDC058239 TaxID=3346395 RepID=UPI0036F0F114